ncbi:hypothetical protein LTR22_028066, partial [Elasticomyces elasticus]
KISISDWPSACTKADATQTGGYFVSYATDSTGAVHLCSVTVCMPGDLRQTPWMRTHSRQDFGEVLYLNISRAYAGQALEEGGSLFRDVANTTAGN